MSYDFYVFPCEGADDLAGAVAAYESDPGTGTLTPGSPVAEFVAAVNAASPEATGDAFLAIAAGGSDASSYVATTWDDPMANLRTVTRNPRAHGLSVLDVQLQTVYDPRHSVEVGLETEGGPRLDWVSRAVVREVVAHVAEGRYHWLTLSRGAGIYVQTLREDDGTWVVEHREGATDAHFGAGTSDPDLVARLLWSWARGDDRWRAMLAFVSIRL